MVFQDCLMNRRIQRSAFIWNKSFFNIVHYTIQKLRVSIIIIIILGENKL